MTTTDSLTVSDRIGRLMQELAIECAHFAGRNLGDLSRFAAQHPERFASLTLVCPRSLDVDVLTPLASRLLVFRGESAGYAEMSGLVEAMPGAELAVAHNDVAWSDMIAHHKEDIVAAFLPFLVAKSSVAVLPPAILQNGARGSVAGINFRVQGSGPPLVLMPLGLIPSQWDPILDVLAEKFCTITLGGPHLGMVALLEMRAATVGYQDMIAALVKDVHLEIGQTVLEVGCGTGSVCRWLAQRNGGHNPIIGVDINRYFLREATDMTRSAGLEGVVQYRKGNVHALPFDDNRFDLTLAVTVLEEVSADVALAEMIRVTKPGASVGVVVRAKDLPFFVNLPLDAAVKAKIEHPSAHGSNAGPDGCADATLYARFQTSPLTDVKMFPYLAAFNEPFVVDAFRGAVSGILNPAEQAALHAACEQVKADGTFVWSYPHHCAVGVKL